jgi:selenide,water dikinase
MATLNAAAAQAIRKIGIGPGKAIHSVTDITGFALLGHLYHMARASGVGIEIDSASVPLLPEVEKLAAEGHVTRGGKENAVYLSNYLEVAPTVSAEQMSVMLDPQTSGGLAICISQTALPRLLAELEAMGVATRSVIGRVVPSEPSRLYIR